MNLFKRERTMSLKRIIYICIALVMSASCFTLKAYAANYKDVPDNAWYAESVKYVTESGLMSGTGDGIFSPNVVLTRAQIVALLYRLAGSPDVTYESRFQDVAVNAWYANAVIWASSEGIVNGTSTNTFSSDAKITREQLAAMIYRYAEFTETDLPAAQNPVKGFKDSWYISDYALDGAELVWRSGIMNGDSQYNFNPRENISRAEAANIFMRFMKTLQGEALTVSVEHKMPDGSSLSAKEKENQALAVAKRIAASIPTDMSDLDRVHMAASIVAYYCTFCNYTMDGKDYRTPYGVFIKGEYSCAGATRALGMVLTCMGYEWKHINENQYSHQWIELYMDGQLGFADGQLGYAGYGSHWSA